MRRLRNCSLFFLTFAALLLSSAPSYAQNTADGTPAFASVENHGDYSINLQNLDVILNVPVRDKAAGAIPFQYSLNYNSECVPQFVPGGPKWDCGFEGTTHNIGMLGLSARPTATGVPYLCPDGVTYTSNLSHWVIVSQDQKTQEPLYIYGYIDTAGCYQRTFTASTIDNTG